MDQAKQLFSWEGDHRRSRVNAAMSQVVIQCQGRGGEGAGTVGVAVILYGGGGEGFPDPMAFEQSSEAHCVAVGMGACQARDSECKGPGAGGCLVIWGTGEETGMAAVRQGRERRSETWQGVGSCWSCRPW